MSLMEDNEFRSLQMLRYLKKALAKKAREDLGNLVEMPVQPYPFFPDFTVSHLEG